jgi:CDP-glycerol glycerophosphotransferase
MPRLSVVVTAVAGATSGPTPDRLRDCVASVLLHQGRSSDVDLEVLVVASDDVAAPPDPRVRTLPYAGAGDPRNAGAAAATGAYLTFLDANDTVTAEAYDRLVSSLERSGSDLATGATRRLDAAGEEVVAPKTTAFDAAHTATNVHELPGLLDDHVAGNKVWRRSFWAGHGLRWPEAAPRDDLLVTVRSYLIAEKVDVVTDVVLVHHVRPGEQRSRSPRADDMVATAEHLEAALVVSTQLRDDGQVALKRIWDAGLVRDDLRHALRNLTEADDETQQRLVDVAAALLVGAGPDAEASMRAVHRLKYHLARRRRLPELLAVVKAERTGELRHTRAVRRGLRYYGDYPFRGDRRLRVPDRVYRLGAELDLRARVDDVWWEGETLHIEGIAHIGLLDVPTSRSGRLWLSLVPSRGKGRSLRLPVERVHRTDVTAAARESAYSYDWSGFRTSVHASKLQGADGWAAGLWRLRATVLRGGVRRRRWVTATSPGRARRPALLEVGEGARIVPTTKSGTFAVEVDVPPAVVESARSDGSDLVLSGSLPGPGAERFEHRLPLSDAGGAVTLSVPGRDRPVPLRAAVDLPRTTIDAGGGYEVVVGRTRHGRLDVVRRTAAPEVRDVTWPEDEPLVLSLHAPDDASLEIVLHSTNAVREQVVPTAVVDTGVDAGVDAEVDAEVDAGVTATLRPEAVPSLAGELPLTQGTWDVMARAHGGDRPQPLRVADAVGHLLPLRRTYGAKSFVLQETDGRLQIVSGPDLRDDERGAVNQRRLQTVDFPAFLARGVRDEVLFESYQSRAYADNARAVFEELAGRDTGLTYRWVVNDGQTVLPGGLHAVRRNSTDHYEALARSRYVVVPNYRPLDAWLTTPADQVVVQTWHGAPFKRIGFDNERGERTSSTDYLDALRRESARWDFLLSPNPPSTDILRGAFDYHGAMLETGYPRCDMFFRPDRDAVAARVREQLGVPVDKTLVLYAPTMRDDHRYGGNRFTLDLQLDLAKARAELGDDHVLLIRRHAKVVDTVTTVDGEFARDVSLWPDVNELLLATDVLVSDYSSLMFDFANTGRPMLFFTYDLEHYRDRLRGFYFDVERLPGPRLMTSDEVIGGIRDAVEVRARHDDAYGAFVADFCTWDDGGASARFVDEVFTRH